MLLHEDLTSRILAAAYRVHNSLGPGHREHVYANALTMLLREQGMKVEPNTYHLVYFDKRPDPVGWCWSDLIVERCVVVELKAKESIQPGHVSQLRAYLRTTGYRVGIVLNFGPLRVDVKREEWSGDVRKSG